MKNNLLKLSPELKSGLLIILAMTIIGPNDLIIPLIKSESGLWQFHFSRSLLALPIILIYLTYQGEKVKIIHLRSVMVRTAFFMLSMLIYFGCLAFLPIAVIGAGMFTSPIFVLLFSAIFFKQKIGYKRILAVTIGSVGVWIILDPTGVNFSLPHLFPVLGGAFLALGNIFTWRWCADENPLILVATFYLGIGLFGFFGATFFSFFPLDNSINSNFIFQGWKSGSMYFWTLVFIQAIASIIAVNLLTKAYQMADTTYLNVFEYFFLISAGVAAWIFFDQKLSLYTIIGIVLIVLAGLIVSLASQSQKIKS